MPTQQETQTVTKEIQKTVLKTISELPTSTVEELVTLLKTRDKNISQEEVLQVIYSISPNKNWHRATPDDIQKEILDYLWTLEAQILFMLPTKQKETTVAEFNQTRLQNKQTKVSKDLIRHVQSLLLVDGKNLGKFRKFEKDLSIQNDVDINTQAVWLIRIILGTINPEQVTSVQEIPSFLVKELQEKYPGIAEKVGKTTQRISEKLTEKYFQKNISETRLRELIASYQVIHHTYKKGTEMEVQAQREFQDGHKLVQYIIEELREAQQIVNESHEGGFLSKLFTGKVRNREGVIKKIDEVINSIDQLNDLSNKANKSSNEKVLLVQKVQSDYENIVLVKTQLENDLYNLNEKLGEIKEKNLEMEKELQDKINSLERAHEKIATLQQKVDEMPGLENKANTIRDELSTAKDISLRLHRRVTKLKEDLLKQNNDKPKNNNKVNNFTIHRVQQNQETAQATPTTNS